MHKYNHRPDGGGRSQQTPAWTNNMEANVFLAPPTWLGLIYTSQNLAITPENGERSQWTDIQFLLPSGVRAVRLKIQVTFLVIWCTEIYIYYTQIKCLPRDILYLKTMLKTSKAEWTCLHIKICQQVSACHWPARRQPRKVLQCARSITKRREDTCFTTGSVTPHPPGFLPTSVTSPVLLLCWCPLFKES